MAANHVQQETASLQDVHQQAVGLLHEGKAAAAVDLLNIHLRRQGPHWGLRHDLAVALAQLGETTNALALFQELVREQPDHVEALSNAGKLALHVRKPDIALPILRRWQEVDPQCVDVHLHLSEALKAQGKLAEAAAQLQSGLRLRPQDADLLLKLGLLLARQRQMKDAEDCYRRALAEKPGFPEALNNLGAILKEQGRLDEATETLQKAVALRPQGISALINLALISMTQNDLPRASAILHDALRIDPRNAQVHNHLGHLLMLQDKLEEARAHLQKAIQEKSDYATAYHNLGLLFGKLGDPAQAVAFLKQALLYQPDFADAHLQKARNHLALGDFAEGWHELEWRWRTGQTALPVWAEPLWNGAPLENKTLLVFCEHDRSETFQFVRFLSAARAKVGRLVLLCPPRLAGILKGCEGVDELVVDGQPLPAFDAACPLLSLPRLLRTTVTNLPSKTPYLRLDLAEATQEPNDGSYNVAILWDETTHDNGLTREHFAPLEKLPNVRLMPLRIGEDADAYLDAAATLKQVKLLVAPDTEAVHLAGALGVPTWVLLGQNSHWRWLKGRDQSPWYPRTRLFRLQRPDGWQEVMACVADALRQHLSATVEAGPTTPLVAQGRTHVTKGQWNEAVLCLTDAVRQAEQPWDVWNLLGVAQLRQGMVEDSLAAFRKVIDKNPQAAEGHNNLGLALLQKGTAAEALVAFKKAIQLDPSTAEYHNNAATVHFQQNQIDDAIRNFDEALRRRGEWLEVHRALGKCYRMKKDFKKAHEQFDLAARIKPDCGDVLGDRGTTFLMERKHEEALACFRKAVEVDPKNPEAWNNLGGLYSEINRTEDSLGTYGRAVELFPGHPNLHLNYALLLLMTGNYEKGFQEYEWRWQCPKSRRRTFTRPQWDGSPLEGRTILLHSEQGLGDTLQFVRYAALVKARGGTVLLECPKHLLGLLSLTPGLDQILAHGDPLPPFDVHAPLLTLPLLFRTRFEDTPAPIPYLFANPERTEEWRTDLARFQGLKVGVAWQGNPKYGGDHYRSIPLVHFLKLADIPNVGFISLQKGFGTEQIAKLPRRLPLVDLDRQIDNSGGFVDSAALIANLDLFITSDTAIAHLAGGLGKPVWLLLGHNCDWRWQRSRPDCPWYANMRLFRQNKFGDWPELFDRVRPELEKWAQARSASEIPATSITIERQPIEPVPIPQPPPRSSLPSTGDFVIATGADAKFFELCKECILSIREKSANRNVRLAFLDLGCTEPQRAWLRTNVDYLKEAQWDFEFPNRDKAPTFLKGLFARPFLQRYFPGHEMYVWLDADTWVQDWYAIELLVSGARRRRGLAIVPELDRSSPRLYGGTPDLQNYARSWFGVAFGPGAGERLASYPVLNAGVFALHKDAPHWTQWQAALNSALQRTCSGMTDQTALNYIVYSRGLHAQTELLPPWCNWTGHNGAPLWDEDQKCLVEPFLPHTRLGIIHLTPKKLTAAALKTVKGNDCEVRVRYPAGPVRAANGTSDDLKEFRELLHAVRPFTMLSEERLTSLYRLAKQVCLEDVPGNFVECGTCRGGASALLAFVLKKYSKRPRKLYGFDTFEGMPQPDEVDKYQGIPANNTPFGAGKLRAPIQDLEQVCNQLNVSDVVTPVKGLFGETLPRFKEEIGTIALLHADADWYSSTMDIFGNLYDSVIDRGFIQIDDYGCWEGCKKAVHDFEQDRRLSFDLHTIDGEGVWLRK